jgi:sugar phosphate isomerase/epimerase
MNDSIHRYMRVGLIHFMAYPQVAQGEGPVLDTLRRIAADDYFEAVEVTGIKDLSVRREAAAMLQTAHMSVAYGAQPRQLSGGLNLNHPDEAERRKAIEALKEAMNEACELGAEGFAFLSGKYELGNEEQALEWLIASTRELCAYAKSKGTMRVAHEVFDHAIDKKSLVGPAPLARRYAEKIRRDFDNFGLMVDLSHIPLIGETAEQAIGPVRDYLIHAHLGNCILRDKNQPGYGDNHPPFGCRGGENDVAEVAEFLRVLFKTGFLNAENRPIVSFEVKPRPGEDSEVVIANAKRTLNRAWELL